MRPTKTRRACRRAAATTRRCTTRAGAWCTRRRCSASESRLGVEQEIVVVFRRRLVVELVAAVLEPRLAYQRVLVERLFARAFRGQQRGAVGDAPPDQHPIARAGVVDVPERVEPRVDAPRPPVAHAAGTEE